MAENLNLKTVDTVDTRPFKKLVMTIGELPTSFIESMTYYELLAWFTNYLETVIIPTVNNNAEAVKELQDLFTELKNFVDNYFDNLDVQEEINNKLDEMVEEGTLQEIVADYLSSRAVFGFDTVADMKSSTNLIDGSYAETLGYFAKNDGGSALYKIRTVTNDDVVDEQFIIEITGDSSNNLVAELVHGSEINVLQLGITNTNFTSTVNSLIEQRYKVYIPKGEYVSTGTININRAETQLVCDGNITASPSASLMFYVSTYRNVIRLNGKCTGNDETNSVLMQISGSGYSSNNNNIYVHYAINVGVGFDLNPSGGKGCAYNKINFDLLVCKKYGILIESGSGVNYVNENWFNGGRIQGLAGMISGIKTIKGESQTDPYNGNVFDHICIDDHYDIAIDLDFAAYNHFNDFRLSEGAPADYYIKLHAGSFENRFSSKSYMPIAKILDENTLWNYLNYFDIRLGYNSWQVASKFKTNNGKKIVARNDYISSGDSDYLLSFPYNSTTYTEPPFYVDSMTTVYFAHDDSTTGETFEYVLPDVFWGGGVKSFYLRIGYLAAGDNFTLKTSSGRLVADRNNTHLTGAISQKWFKVEYVGNIQGGRWKVFPVS